MTFVSYAQNFEDVMLWRALRDVENGRYIDIGAQDPVVDSVSLAFYNAGWRGTHVEPTSFYAARLRELRPDEAVIEAAVTDAHGPIEFFEFPDTGISTGRPDIAEHHEKVGYASRKIFAPTARLDQLLEMFDGDIHWMKIDVEGMEADVLRSWGASERRPWVLVIEATYPSTQQLTHEAWISLVHERGYRKVFFDGLSCYFLHEGQAARAERFQAPANVFDGFAVGPQHFSGSLLRERVTAADAQLEAERSNLAQVQAELGRTCAERDVAQQERGTMLERLAAAEQSNCESLERLAAAEQSNREALERLVQNEQSRRSEIEGAWAQRLAAEEALRSDSREREDALRQSAVAAELRLAEATAVVARLEERSAQLQLRLADAQSATLSAAQDRDAARVEGEEAKERFNAEKAALIRQLGEAEQRNAQLGVELDGARSALASLSANVERVAARPAGAWERLGRALRLYHRSSPWQEVVQQYRALKDDPAPLGGKTESEEIETSNHMHNSARNDARNPYLRANSLDELLDWNDVDFVRCAYVTVLGRQPDPEGEAYYTRRIRSGHSKLEVLWQLRRSPEGPHHDPGIRGFDRMLKRSWWERSRLGWLVNAFTQGEGNGQAWRRHRALLASIERNCREIEHNGQRQSTQATPSHHAQLAAPASHEASPDHAEQSTVEHAVANEDPHLAALTRREQKLYAVLQA